MARKLVINIDKVHLVEHMHGYHTGLGFFEERERKTGWIGTESMRCAVKVVQPGRQSPLFSAMHSSEEMGFVISGVGSYEVSLRDKDGVRNVLESFPIRAGDFLLAPEGHTDTSFEIQNTGSDELKFVAFRALGHMTNLARIDEARAVIGGYVERRWLKEPSNSAGYDFDGRVLCTIDRDDFRMLITFDQFGTIWANGCPLTDEPHENIEKRIDRLMEFERETKRTSLAV